MRNRLRYVDAYTRAAALAAQTGEAHTIIASDTGRRFGVIETAQADADRAVLTVYPDGCLDREPAEAALAY